eukprot:8425184-Pyramimonas_sp.AAC.1
MLPLPRKAPKTFGLLVVHHGLERGAPDISICMYIHTYIYTYIRMYMRRLERRLENMNCCHLGARLARRLRGAHDAAVGWGRERNPLGRRQVP